MNMYLTGFPGMKIDGADGYEKLGFFEIMSTPLFYSANAGDRLILRDKKYKFIVATYAPEIDPKWIYTYDYAPDQGWLDYQYDLKDDGYTQNDYVFNKQTYFRVCLQKIDGTMFNADEDINDIMVFEARPATPYEVKPWIIAETNRVSKIVAGLRNESTMVFALMTDTHYNVNGTWQDTAASIKLCHEAICFDGIIHLGDISDGMVTKDATRYYAKKTISDLESHGIPLWVAIGNHDTNYFRNNPQRFSIKEQRELYLNGKDLRYFVDLPQVRLMFLDSFDPEEKLRYGYNNECIDWLNNSLNNMEPGRKAIIFSHLPPITRLQFWAKAMRGNEALTGILHRNKNNILAWINGHNHADHLDNKEGVPIISVANAKCESFHERKPEGFITPDRKLNDNSQELWDILLVDAKSSTLRFIRFGAGKDRVISNGAAVWL